MQKKNLLLFLVLLVPALFMKVEAKVFTVEEVVTEFNKEVKEKYTTLGDLKATVDTYNKKIKLTQDSSESTLDYTDTYIEYKYTGGTPTDGNNSEEYRKHLIYNAFLDSLFSLAKVKDCYSVDYIVSYENNFDKYNVELVYTDYKYNVKNDAGETVEKDSSYISDFKIGFDGDKITVFAEAYAKSKHFDLVPKLNMKIIDGAVSYNFKLDYTKENDDDVPYCIVYRSDSLDGTYTKIGNDNMSVSCEERSDGVYLVDDTAVSGSTYYYKAQVVGSDKFSNILKVDLANNIVTDTSNGEIIDAPSKDTEDKETHTDDKKEDTKKDLQNPETGDFLPMLSILILLLASITVWSRVKNKFIRI